MDKVKAYQLALNMYEEDNNRLRDQFRTLTEKFLHFEKKINVLETTKNVAEFRLEEMKWQATEWQIKYEELLENKQDEELEFKEKIKNLTTSATGWQLKYENLLEEYQRLKSKYEYQIKINAKSASFK